MIGSRVGIGFRVYVKRGCSSMGTTERKGRCTVSAEVVIVFPPCQGGCCRWGSYILLPFWWGESCVLCFVIFGPSQKWGGGMHVVGHTVRFYSFVYFSNRNKIAFVWGTYCACVYVSLWGSYPDKRRVLLHLTFLVWVPSCFGAKLHRLGVVVTPYTVRKISARDLRRAPLGLPGV